MDPYETLGVDKTANKSEIKKAYRELALENHPDRGGDEKRFKQINEAYSILSDDQKRSHYDARRDGMPFSFGDIFRNFAGGGAPRGFSDMFGGFQRRQKEKTVTETTDREIIFDIKVSLADLKRGVHRVGSYLRRIKCDGCEGEGGEGKNSCTACQGTGMRVVHMTPNIVHQTMCPLCDGDGSVYINKCKICNGAGFKEIKNQLIFEIKEVKQ
jgi:molecular chaperone DnaJ